MFRVIRLLNIFFLNSGNEVAYIAVNITATEYWLNRPLRKRDLPSCLIILNLI